MPTYKPQGRGGAALDRAPSTFATAGRALRTRPTWRPAAGGGGGPGWNGAVRDRVLAGFARRWSPQQIAGWPGIAGCSATRHLPVRLPQQARARTTGGLASGQDQTGLAGSGAQHARFIDRIPIHQRVGGGYAGDLWPPELMSFVGACSPGPPRAHLPSQERRCRAGFPRPPDPHRQRRVRPLPPPPPGDSRIAPTTTREPANRRGSCLRRNDGWGVSPPPRGLSRRRRTPAGRRRRSLAGAARHCRPRGGR